MNGWAKWLRRIGRVAASLALFGLLSWGGWWLLTDARSPLPPEWNPLEPLDVAAPVTPLTAGKLARAAADPMRCIAALDGHAIFDRMEPLRESADCFVDPRLRLVEVGSTRLDPVETSCAVALRLAMWERHGLRPAAEAHLGAAVVEIRHLSSYSCRPIRTMAGDGRRMSTHSRGLAIDVRGFTLADGRGIGLVEDWDGEAGATGFLGAARDAACRWFGTVLGPDFNRLHADHFHLQAPGRGTCR